MICQLALPATLAAFVAYQEQLLGRNLTADEQEVDAAYLKLFNAVATGELDGFTVLTKIDLLSKGGQEPFLAQVLAVARRWVLHAMLQGEVHGKGGSKE